MILLAALLSAQTPATPAPAAPPPPPPKCEGADYAAFDFWVGDWDVVRTGTDAVVARSLIEKLYAGCAVRENWMPLRGGPGGSLNGYDPRTKQWRQTWIGAAPGPVYFTGGMEGDRMVLAGDWPGSGPNGEDGITRMTYSRVEGASVRQHGEFSGDGGKTWATTFDFTYRPRKEKAP